MKKSQHFKAHKVLVSALGLSLVFGLSSHSAQAAESGFSNYVTDVVELPVRRDAGYKYKILNMIKSGTPVKILKVNDEGWAHIEYSRGSKNSRGWVPSSMLQNQPIARERLQQQIDKTSSIETKYNALQQELDTLKTRFEATSEELATIKQEKFETSQELNRLTAISTNAVELDRENQEMRERMSELENDNTIMREQIDQSEDSIKRQWFLTGGGVLLLGLLLGRFFRPPQKRKRWGEL